MTTPLIYGYSLKTILALSFCESVHFSADLKSRYLLFANNSLRVSPFSKVRGIYFFFSPLASCLAFVSSCMASHRCPILIRDYFTHAFRKVKSDFLHRLECSFRDLFYNSNDIVGFGSLDDCHDGSSTPMCFSIGDDSV